MHEYEIVSLMHVEAHFLALAIPRFTTCGSKRELAIVRQRAKNI